MIVRVDETGGRSFYLVFRGMAAGGKFLCGDHHRSKASDYSFLIGI